MSATGRGAVRQKDDAYDTPPDAVDAILQHLPIAGPILEPGCGRGAIVGRLLAAGVHAPSIVGVELDVYRAAECRKKHRIEVMTRDFLTFDLGGFGLAIGNPPFALALEFAQRCRLLTAPVRGTTALLLRLSWIAPADRASFLAEHPADLFVLERRPEFVASLHCIANDTKRGCGWAETMAIDATRPKRCPNCGGKTDCNTSDAAEYAWAVFGPGRGGRWYRLPAPKETT